jgi:hypothetical protein
MSATQRSRSARLTEMVLRDERAESRCSWPSSWLPLMNDAPAVTQELLAFAAWSMCKQRKA